MENIITICIFIPCVQGLPITTQDQIERGVLHAQTQTVRMALYEIIGNACPHLSETETQISITVLESAVMENSCLATVTCYPDHSILFDQKLKKHLVPERITKKLMEVFPDLKFFETILTDDSVSSFEERKK